MISTDKTQVYVGRNHVDKVIFLNMGFPMQHEVLNDSDPNMASLYNLEIYPNSVAVQSI